LTIRSRSCGAAPSRPTRPRTRPCRALLIINAQHESDIHERFAEDPWARSERLRITRVEPWNVFVGAERLAS
jgi:hypothetical protein